MEKSLLSMGLLFREIFYEDRQHFRDMISVHLARIIHELATPTVDMNALPGVLGPRTLRRTVQVRLGFKPLRLPGGTSIFTVSQHQFMNYPGYEQRGKRPSRCFLFLYVSAEMLILA